MMEDVDIYHVGKEQSVYISHNAPHIALRKTSPLQRNIYVRTITVVTTSTRSVKKHLTHCRNLGKNALQF